MLFEIEYTQNTQKKKADKLGAASNSCLHFKVITTTIGVKDLQPLIVMNNFMFAYAPQPSQLSHHPYSVWSAAHSFLLQKVFKAKKLIKSNFDNKLLTILNLRKTFIIYELL